MKTTRLWAMLVCLVAVAFGGMADAEFLTVEQLEDHGVAAGPPCEVLPGPGALVHLQLHDLLGVVEGVEEILKAGIPEKAAPPEIQGLLQTEHPLLTMLGMQTMQQPLTAELIEQLTGLDTRRTVGLTLYLGDPRRMFVLSIPSRSRQSLVPMLNEALQPSRVEQVNVSGKKAVRLVSKRLKFMPELYFVSSADTLYLCGDRSLVQALHLTPAAQRFGQDPFMRRALPATDDKQIRMVLNPAMAKPLALQLQGLSMVAKIMVPRQRAVLMERIPAEAKQQMEMQFRMQLGVRDLDELIDYVECIAMATMEQGVDFISGRLLAFEGFTVAASLKGGFVEFNADLYSSRFDAETSTGALPMDQVKQALAWLGPETQSFTVTGKKPQKKEAPILTAWAKRVQKKCEAKGLDWAGMTRFVEMLDSLKPVPKVASESPWILTMHAPLHRAPSLEEAANLEEYLAMLGGPVYCPVKVMPDQGPDFLETCFREETEALNRNRELGWEFENSIQKQNPWLVQENRFHMASLDSGVTRYTRESVWTSRSGFFGYDQHELVNRRVTHARRVGDYLVTHRGAQGSSWLAGLKAGPSGRIAPGVTDLLNRVPDGANSVSIQRVLQNVPRWMGFIDALESRLHKDVRQYLEKAQAAVDNSSDLEAAKHEIRGMRMPLVIGSVCIDRETKKVYAILPAGNMPLVLPRPKVVPLVSKLLEDYAAQADSVGGSLVYTRISDESYQFSAMQSTEALTTFTRTVGNALVENYLSSQEGMVKLQRSISTPRDGDRSAFDEVVARNPQWAGIPQPQPKVPAKPGKTIPGRPASVDKRLLDLSGHYNGALNDTWHKGGLSNNTLRDLPRGVQTVDAVTFDVRGILQLSGRQAERELRVQFPQRIADIPVHQKAQKMHFLHGCGWQSPVGTTLGSYVLHYTNGQVRSIPIVYGKDVRDWWMVEGGMDNVNVAWTGQNHASPSGPPIGVCKTTWVNPLPDVEIDHIDYESAMKNSAPFLIAVTVE